MKFYGFWIWFFSKIFFNVLNVTPPPPKKVPSHSRHITKLEKDLYKLTPFLSLGPCSRLRSRGPEVSIYLSSCVCVCPEVSGKGMLFPVGSFFYCRLKKQGTALCKGVKELSSISSNPVQIRLWPKATKRWSLVTFPFLFCNEMWITTRRYCHWKAENLLLKGHLQVQWSIAVSPPPPPTTLKTILSTKHHCSVILTVCWEDQLLSSLCLKLMWLVRLYDIWTKSQSSSEK